MKISLCSFVKNESAHIEAMIRSALGLVDEVNILDTGSTDNTLEIMRGIAAEHKEITFNIAECEFSNFATIRKTSFDMATGDWVLMLDADEEISEYYFADYRKLINDENAEAWYIPRRNWLHWAIHEGFTSKQKIEIPILSNPNYFYSYPDWQARLIKNNKQFAWTNKVHESLVGCEIKYSATDAHIEHYHFIVKTHQQRHELYTLYGKLAEKKE